VLGLQDTIWSLVLVYPSVTVPFSVWLLMGFFKSIPKELEDAAMVDGLTRFGAFVKMVIPISLSGILTVVIFTFTLVTQDFVFGRRNLFMRLLLSHRNHSRWWGWACPSFWSAATSITGER